MVENMNGLPQARDFPVLLRQYSWDANHAAFGWPPDTLVNSFAWIVSLEERYAEAVERKDLPIQLIAELILWGGNQNKILAKFSRGIRNGGGYDDRIRRVIEQLDNPGEAIQVALTFQGIGLTYASKLLRFCRPATYGALDRNIRGALGPNLRRIHDGNNQSERAGYTDFLKLIYKYQRDLHLAGISRPAYGLRAMSLDWTAAEVEMALFAWASTMPKRQGSKEEDTE